MAKLLYCDRGAGATVQSSPRLPPVTSARRDGWEAEEPLGGDIQAPRRPDYTEAP